MKDYNSTKKKCQFCNQIIPMKRKRDQNKNYCNRKCASSSKSLFGSCNYCGIKIKLNLTNSNQRRKFCSRQCANKSREKTHIRTCKRCNKEFLLKNIAYENKSANSGKFCSVECATRKYSFDESFFSEINLESEAYWLGFLFADGNIYNTQVTLKLKRSDENHLLKFKKAIKSEHPIHKVKNKTFKNCYLSSFFIGSKKLSKDLISLGMTPNKTKTIKFPNIKNNLQRHFIRGFFDGDGCLYIDKKGRKHWSIFSGSEQILREIKKILEDNNIRCNLHSKKGGFCLRTSKQKNIDLIFNFMYHNSLSYMKRKKEKFLL